MGGPLLLPGPPPVEFLLFPTLGLHHGQDCPQGQLLLLPGPPKVGCLLSELSLSAEALASGTPSSDWYMGGKDIEGVLKSNLCVL